MPEAGGQPIRLGMWLPRLLAEAGIVAPDGTEDAGDWNRWPGPARCSSRYRSIAAAAIGFGLITEPQRNTWLAHMAIANNATPACSGHC